MKRLLVATVISGLAIVTGGCGSESPSGTDAGVTDTVDSGGVDECALGSILCGDKCCNTVHQYCNGSACATCACASGQECGTDQCGYPCGADNGGCPSGQVCGSDDKCGTGG